MKKKCLIIFVFMLSACAVTGAPAPDKLEKAMELVNQGTIQLEAGQLDNAHASFSLARELYNIPAAVDGLGCVAFMREEYKLAEDYFIQAYSLDNTYVDSMGNLALLYEALGFYHEAERLYKLALKDNPTNYRLRSNFAAFIAEYNTGALDDEKRRKARAEFLKARSVSNHPIIEANLSLINRY